MIWPHELKAPMRVKDPWTSAQRQTMTDNAQRIAHAVKAGASLKLQASGKWFSVVVKGCELIAPMERV